MPNICINELIVLTGKTRPTIKKALDGIAFLDGPQSAKLYNSKVALEKIYFAPSESGESFVSNAEAQRLLTIARREEIGLNMEVTRGERIALEVLEDVNDSVFSNIAGMLKALKGKTVTDDSVNDMLTELRGISAKING